MATAEQMPHEEPNSDEEIELNEGNIEVIRDSKVDKRILSIVDITETNKELEDQAREKDLQPLREVEAMIETDLAEKETAKKEAEQKKMEAVREELKEQADWQERERLAAELLGDEGMKEVEEEIASAEAGREAGRILEKDPELKKRLKEEIEEVDMLKKEDEKPTAISEIGPEERGFKGDAKLPEGEDRELRAELNVQLEEAEASEKGWKAARDKLDAMKVDMDKPRGLFGRFGLGVKKVFNRELRAAHNEYSKKLKAWNKSKTRIEELNAILDIDEGPDAQLRHRPKSGGGGQTPTGSVSIRGENL
ncbi:MAG: hypothetical protein U9Q03_03035 [Patescibacteria group bacterium]|nr:hypothetical protein [Patescibacteria group bacterium]